eukprot:TRINITY_DN23740_c0_g2_i1.p1 TRINITY_DN23740_c0_g2~~TRINITY_DN23740_c0_g2_i1.p1  ORF type:complete len:745 (-),score=76.67 TRINITY_DN23740_c0_g2_i1:218-2188(-)
MTSSIASLVSRTSRSKSMTSRASSCSSSSRDSRVERTSPRGTRSARSFSFSSAMLVNHVFSTETTRHLSDRLHKFKTEREEERKKQYRHVLLVSGSALIIICTVELILHLSFLILDDSFDTVLLAMRCLGSLFTAFFLISMALLAVVLVDFNAFMEEHVALRWWSLLCLLVCTLSQCVAPPYFGVFGSLAIVSFNRCLWAHQMFLLVLSVWLLDSAAAFAYIGASLVQVSFEYSMYWLCCAGGFALAAIVWLLWHSLRLWRADDETDVDCTSSNSLYKIITQYLLLMGMISGAFSGLLVFDVNSIDESTQRRAYAGAVLLVPLVILMMLGVDRLQIQAAVRFGLLDQLSQERDGAFLASMMDVTMIAVGKTWWVHRAAGEENMTYAEHDQKRNWKIGKIVEVQDNHFVVQVGGGVEHIQDSIRRNVSSDDILCLARANLRCLDWRHFSVEVLKGDLVNRRSLTSSTFLSFARPLHDGEERIDFFVSHSWYDDVQSKFDQLRYIAAKFVQEHGREPTFWLDHVCIDQQNIIDGLRTLPVNILSCNKVVVLCGTTYLSRLWCAWEMCTRMSFDPPEVATSSIIVCPLGDANPADLRARFNNFDILKAKCYDPNEEARVLSVVRALGPGRFNSLVKRLGASTIHRRTRASAVDDTIVSV